MKDNDLVSIITPCYNSSKYIKQAIESVITQTYSNWEMIIVDDKSNDNTVEIIHQYCLIDNRIRFKQLHRNSGSASRPRNEAIKAANGRFIAFLDSDDVWHPNKLEEQLKCFNRSDIAIVYSNYFKISDGDINTNSIIFAPKQVDYNKLFYGNVIACLTAIYDTNKVGKVFFQNVGHEDFVVWLSILKHGYIAVNANLVLASYRIRPKSLSSNKIKTIYWIWNIYRNIEKKSLICSLFYFSITMFRSLLKYLK